MYLLHGKQYQTLGDLVEQLDLPLDTTEDQPEENSSNEM